MFYRIFTVAENGWIELVKRKALWVLLASVVLGFFVPIFIQYKLTLAFSGGHAWKGASRDSVYILYKLLLFIGLCTAMLFGAGVLESEVTKRTLSSVMIRPIRRWEYIAGRAMSVMFLYTLFTVAGLLCIYMSVVVFGSSMPNIFIWGVLQRLCTGVAWIVIAVSLASILTSTSSVITSLLTLIFLSWLMLHIPNEVSYVIPILKQIVHYLTPTDWAGDFMSIQQIRGAGNQSISLNALIMLDNLMYAVVVFLGCVWVFACRDLKLRE